MSEFKIGDLVEFVASVHYYELEPGDVGVIEEEWSEEIIVRFEGRENVKDHKAPNEDKSLFYMYDDEIVPYRGKPLIYRREKDA